ncbi:TonB-dependent receptor plug domain-containing protein [Roseateles chitinivorans]|uniref:TonB-dependent receptor plug domain-containing protein n=1 Tax=Roseateles chitinivorans TaxID=2917965 RepID=UPI003D677743
MLSAAARAEAQSSNQNIPASSSRPLEKVQIDGASSTDVQNRREFVAGKLVISRKSIEDSGQTTVYEVLKREPSVTIAGDGKLGLLGLPGYTRILVDGQPPAPGRSPLELDVVQIEKIEIVKGSMAEFGPFGVAGTINILTRRVERKRTASLRINGGLSPSSGDAGFAWSNTVRPSDDSWGLSNRVSLRRKEQDISQRLTIETPDGQGALAPSRLTASNRSEGLTQLMASSSYSNKLSATNDLESNPSALLWQTDTRFTDRHDWVRQSTLGTSTGRADGKLLSLSLPIEWKHADADGTRAQLGYEYSWMKLDRGSDRQDHALGGIAGEEALAEQSLSQRHEMNVLRFEFSREMLEAHAVKIGGSLGWQSQRASAPAFLNGAPDPAFMSFGSDSAVTARRDDAFVQDEWTLSKRWAATLGLSAARRTTSVREGSFLSRNAYETYAPSLHLAHKLTEDGREKLRLSLAKAYNAPDNDLYSLRPVINPLAPCIAGAACGPNTIDNADTAGNPHLRPERSMGLTLSYEKYFGASSMVGVDYFERRLTDVIGQSVALEDVSWAQSPRYVIRPENLGNARLRGISVDARMALTELDASLPKVELRSGLTFSRSRLDTLPAPDNRMADQAPWSAKLGVRYKLRSVPLELSADANWRPGVWSRNAAERRTWQDRREDVSAQATWTLSPASKLRVGANNLLSRDTRRIDVLGDSAMPDARVSTWTRGVPSVTLSLETRL